MKSKSLATEKTKQAIKAPLTIWKASLPFFLGAVLFLMVCLCSASTIKPATMVWPSGPHPGPSCALHSCGTGMGVPCFFWLPWS